MAINDLVNWIDAKLFKVPMSSGVELPERERFNFTAPLVATDNPTLKSTDLSIDPSALVITPANAATLKTWRPSVRLIITSNIENFASVSTAQALTLIAADDVLLVGQTDHKQNGPYTCGPVVAGVTTLARASWAAVSSDFTPRMRIPVGAEDPVYAGDIFELATTGAIVLGTTLLTFSNAGTLTVIERGLIDSATDIATPLSVALRASDGSMHATGLTFTVDVAATISGPQSVTGAGAAVTIRGPRGKAGFAGATVTIASGGGGTSGTDLPGDLKLDLGVPVAGVSAKLNIVVNNTTALRVYQSAAAELTFDFGAPTNTLVFASGAIKIANLSTGVVHAGSTGVLTSSLAVTSCRRTMASASIISSSRLMGVTRPTVTIR